MCVCVCVCVCVCGAPVIGADAEGVAARGADGQLAVDGPGVVGAGHPGGDGSELLKRPQRHLRDGALARKVEAVDARVGQAQVGHRAQARVGPEDAHGDARRDVPRGVALGAVEAGRFGGATGCVDQIALGVRPCVLELLGNTSAPLEALDVDDLAARAEVLGGAALYRPVQPCPPVHVYAM